MCTQTDNLNFHTLTPCSNLSNEVYFDALDAALANEDVTNIAVTGPYGSGKSSVIRSYLCAQKEHPTTSQQLKPVSISLVASEAPRKSPTPEEKEKTCEQLDLHTIEYEILEQLFFKIREKDAPDSHISRIREIQRWRLWLYAISSVLTLGSIIYLYNPHAYFSWFNISLFQTAPIWISILCLLICSLTLGYIIYKVARIIIGATIQKISLKIADIDLKNKTEKSVLNQHIDELIYLFQQTQWNLVVFEDLDRFNNENIFLKLKEINLLINNADSIRQRVVFIYAVKDDLFVLGKERTKFFDFIVPIIPFVDGNNADEIMRRELADYSISNKLCDILAYYVNDMRLINNICNEFKIYRKKIFLHEDGLSNDRELAIIAYKNIYPVDFSNLLQRKGLLYETLHKKDSIVSKLTRQLQEEVKDITKRQQAMQDNVNISIKMLRLEYISALERKLPANSNFGLSGKRVHVEDLVSDTNFQAVMNGDLQYIYSGSSSKLPYTFDDIDKKVNKTSYNQRLAVLQDIAQNDDLTAQAYDKQQQIRIIKSLNWSSIISQYHPSIFDENTTEYPQKQKDLITILMQCEYITEHYAEYISLFHESSLSKSDKHFLIFVYRNMNVSPDYSIQNPHRVLEKIDDEEFNFVACQNYDLIQELFNTTDFETKKNRWLNIISEERQEYIEFLGQYLSTEVDVKNIVYQICEVWPNIWQCYANKDEYNTSKILRDIVLYAPINKISEIFQINEPILRDDPHYFDNNTDLQRLCNVALKLQLKFTRLEGISAEVREFLIANNLYAIDSRMLKLLIKEGEHKYNFETSNYTFFKANAELHQICQYIDANISVYIDKVWSQFVTSNEEEPYFIKLLENKALGEKQRDLIINKNNVGIHNWNSLNSPELCVDGLLKYGKLDATWENVASVYDWYGCSFEEQLIHFLNMSYVYKKLAIHPITDVGTILDNETIIAFKNELLYNADLTDEAFRALVHSIGKVKNFDSSKLTEDKALILIQEQTIDISLKMYTLLKKSYTTVHIDYLVAFHKTILPLMSSDALDAADLALLSMKNIKIPSRIMYVPHISPSSVKDSKNIRFFIGIPFVGTRGRLSVEQKKAILLHKSIAPVERIRCYLNVSTIFTVSEIRDFLLALGQPYSNLLHAQAVLPYSTENERFVEVLKTLKYVSSNKTNRLVGKIRVYMCK